MTSCTAFRLSASALARVAAWSAGALLAVSPAHALYKVVNPDGSTTYTDRPPPAAANTKVTPLGRRGTAAAPAAPELALPPELRQAVRRYPVTLYTAPDCPPCDTARRFLQQRGVPYAERRAVTGDDAAALERLVGGRTVPALMIGTQPLRGYAEADWAVYLDAAGYPRESRLPRDWTPPAAAPLVERATAAAPAQPPAAAAPAPTTAEPPAEPRPSDAEPTPAVRF